MPKVDLSALRDTNRDERVLVLAPIGRDATMTAHFLAEAGIAAQVCDDAETLCHEIESGCGLAFLTGEVLTSATLHKLTQCVREQPPWSDMPLLVLTSGGGESPVNADALTALGKAGNVTLIERPVRPATLLSSIQSALRARRRQYDVRDYLTEQNHVREALQRSEERLRIALDAAQLGAWQLDLESGRVDCTARCKADFGLSPDDDFSFDVFLHCVHEEDRPRVSDAITNAIRDHTDYLCEYRVWWPDGSLHWILASGRAKYDSDGEPYGMVGVTDDITHRKNAEHEREQLLLGEQSARQEAETANRLKDEFLATVSHELRTPLMAILGWANLMRLGDLDRKTSAAAVKTIERNAHSQVQLINDLLDVSRITRGELRLHLRRVELKEIIAAAVDVVRPLAEAGDITLHLSLDENASALDGDPDRLQQIVWNLLTNAIKFTPPGGRVEIILQRANEEAEIRISDNGQGIAPQFLPHVFDRFRQADSSSTRSYGGLGLGLSIVSQLVALHGGTVEARSDGEGKGATFTVRLPLHAATSEENASSATNVADDDTPHRNAAPYETIRSSSAPIAEPETSGLTRLDDVKILLVEDEADTRDMLRTVFQHAGAQVRAAESVAQALRVLETWQPDVLVSDIGLPSEDGYSLMEQWRATETERGLAFLPAIALTAFAKTEDRERALRAGFQKHLSKPIEPAELTAAVAALTSQKSPVA